MKINKVLTGSSQFTDRFTSRRRAPIGRHLFDRQCKDLDIEHRLSPPRHPQTNGMVERSDGRVAEVIKQTRFASAAELESTLTNCVTIYNHHTPQRVLDHLPPVKAMPQWRRDRPELLVKNGLINKRDLTHNQT